MNDTLAVLWVLGAGVYLGVRLNEWWQSQQPHASACRVNGVALQDCRCSEGRPAFVQPEPAGVQ